MRGIAQRHQTPVSEGAHHSLPLPLSKYGEQRSLFRISAFDVTGCRRSTRQGWWLRSHFFPALDRDNPFVSPHHGAWDRSVTNCSDFYHLENSNGQQWANISLYDGRTFLCSEHGAEQHGWKLAGQAFDTPSKAHHQMLLPPEWKPTCSNGPQHHNAFNCKGDVERKQEAHWQPGRLQQKAPLKPYWDPPAI